MANSRGKPKSKSKAREVVRLATEAPSCVLKELPPDKWVAAGRTAVAFNPANQVGLGAAAPTLSPQHIALLINKYWGAAGVKLSVQFLDVSSADLKNKIVAHMNAWADYANVSFALTGGQGQVRIATTRGDGYWSYLGTDITHIPLDQPTMNLDSFSLSTPDSEYRRVVRHETGHCLDGDTLIDCPRDLVKYPLGIPIKDLVGQQPWVYAWKDGKVVVRKATRVWLSKRSVETVRVVLRAGRGPGRRKYLPPLELVGTADHPVLLRDGVTWKNLGDLKPGDRVCSLYRSGNGPRSRLLWTGLSGRIREHTFVAEEVYGRRPDGHDCHHRDENKLNQHPDNLEWKPEFDHHSDHGRGRKRSPEAIAATAAFWRGRKHTPEAKAKMSVSQRLKAPASAETRAKISKIWKGKKQSPEMIEKRAAAVRAFHAKRKAVTDNHTVVSVEPAGVRDVYDMTVPDADSFVANGVVVHNSLGFPHEQQRPEIVALMDPQKTYAYFLRTQGWDKATVDAQILSPLNPTAIRATNPDVRSIMMYQFPGSIMKNGQAIPGGVDIDPVDGQFASQIYPKTDGPPVTPVPAGGAVTISLKYDPSTRTVSGVTVS